MEGAEVQEVRVSWVAPEGEGVPWVDVETFQKTCDVDSRYFASL